MKILSVIENGFGSAYYRQVVPMRAMRDAGYAVTLATDPGTVPPKTLAAHDLIQLSRVAHSADAIIAAIRDLQSKGKRVIIDYDDDFLHIPPHNPAASVIDPAATIRAIQAADAITVTSTALASVYRPYATQIGIVPNYVDVARWPSPEPRSGPLTIGLVGSASHHEDWKVIAGPMRRILARYNVRFLIAGYCPDYLTELATETIGWQGINSYQQTVNRIDIGLCPLLDDEFNRRKTPIKAMEYGMAQAAVVASPTLYRDLIQGRGLLARTEADWEDAIEALIVSRSLRARLSRALHAYGTTRLDVARHTAAIYSTYRTLFQGAIKWTKLPPQPPHRMGRERTTRT